MKQRTLILGHGKMGHARERVEDYLKLMHKMGNSAV